MFFGPACLAGGLQVGRRTEVLKVLVVEALF
jgi:hypothetical protein